ncbi:YoaK family protein [Methylobacterium organophilum]|uniref:DUF1275 domain-containing protein n=1 Tax=Methylobacterium organophilum TaxID=410 RepID=A0ABQ4TA09_METOR|nr:YoaK family protein [Methylobacterium organophilum]UMY16438.1 DUF1275 domain-containing protein [Methylobacterium organophilum]GJE27156.1 hypothetical protein LKMONMHP_2012 [Methylobacterium organophilum]
MENKAFPASSTTRIPFALALSALAGAADSIGFLEFSQLFMSFMSGNTTRFGTAVSHADWVGTFRFGSVIALFCVGAFFGTLLAAWSGRWRLTVLLIAQAVFLAIGLYVPNGSEAFPLHAYPIVFALGIQNATLQDGEGRSIALTYVTGAVVRFGTGLANMVLHKPAPSFWIQAPLWSALTVGAIAGGTLHIYFGEQAFLFPAALAAILSAIALILTLVAPGSAYVSGESAPQPDAHPEARPTATFI